jgi:hypothetical protein
LDVPPYLLGLDPTLYFDRSHLSKYILQLAHSVNAGFPCGQMGKAVVE